MKRLMSLLLTAMILALLLPAAVFAEESAHLEITVANWDIANGFPEDGSRDAVLTEVEKRFNVTFVPMNVGWGDYGEKYNSWAAAGTMPDIAGACSWIGSSTYYQWIEDGVVRALPNVENYPDVAKYMDLPEVLAYQVEGEHYFFPRMTYYDASYWCMDRGLYIRTDWLENLGLEMPTTGDELLKTMQAFAENDPDGNGEKDTIGFAYNAVFPTSQQIACYGYTDGRWVKSGDRWVLPAFEENTIPLIDMLRTAFRNGWMDQDFAARATNDCQELFASGRVGILAKQVSPKHVNDVNKLWASLQPEKSFLDCVAIVPLVGEDATCFQEMAYWSETYIGGHVDDEKADRIMQIMDFLYSDEGMMLTTYGFEGIDYQLTDDGEIELLLPMKENGMRQTMGEKYPSCGWLAYLAGWNGDLLQYVSPTIPVEIREMCKAEYERRVAEWKSPNLDWEIAALDLEAKRENTANSTTQWSIIIADTSDTPTEELYRQALAEWNAQGYAAACEAVTAAAAERGK
ncbi:MAG: hypothetical protein ACOYI8_07570 [Christensenellales bacterium]|jgi:putative aldouronate transport system substrate-binding protein